MIDSLELPEDVSRAYDITISRLMHVFDDIPLCGALHDAAKHYLVHRGKLVRPLLALATAHSLNSCPSRVIDVAIAIELVHIAALLQDDIIDRHVVRRGTRTPYSAYGAELSLLASNLFIAKSVEHITRTGSRDAVQELINASIRLTIGQSLELELMRTRSVSLGRYFKVVLNKTAPLFEASMTLSAYILNRLDVLRALRLIGRFLGISYQIRDDILDYLGVDRDNPPGESYEMNITAILSRSYGDPLRKALDIMQSYLRCAKRLVRETFNESGRKLFISLIDRLYRLDGLKV